MRVVIDTRLRGPVMTGAGRYLACLIPALAGIFEDDEFVLIVPARSEDIWKELPDNVSIRSVNIPPASVKQHLMLNNVIKKSEAHIFHYPMFDLPLSMPTPAVITIHDLNAMLFPDYYTKGKWWRKPAAKWLHRSGIKRARRIITPSCAAANDLCSMFPKAKEKVVPVQHGYKRACSGGTNGSYQELKDRINLPPEYILYVGVHRPHKNLEGLIRAISYLRKSGNKIFLVVAGSIDERFTGPQKVVSRLRLGDAVKFIGHAYDEELAVLYKNSLCMVFPSFLEGFGLPLLEAMDYGTPIACSDIPVHREVAGDAAIFFNPHSPENMAEVISRLINDERLRRELIQAGQNRLQAFTWENSARKTMEVYRQAAELG